MLDDHIGFGKASLDIAHLELEPLDHIGLFVGDILDALGAQMVVQDRCVRLHGLDRIDHMRQHLVIDLDQLEGGLLGDRFRCRRDPQRNSLAERRRRLVFE